MKGSEVSFFKNISSGESLGLITVDRTAKIYGMENLYTFLHLTFQEYLAAYHVAHLTEEEQVQLINEYSMSDNMRVVWKFYCGLMKFKSQDSKFGQLMDSSDDDLFKVQCAFESQQPPTCDHVVQSGCSGQLSFRKKFLNPTDFTAIGYVLRYVSLAVNIDFVLNECRFGEEGVQALQNEAKDRLNLLKSLSFHGGDCSKEQFKAVRSFLRNVPNLKTLSLTNTTLGIEKTKLFAEKLTLPDLKTESLTLPYLEVLHLSLNECNAKVLKILSSMCSDKLQCIRFDPPVQLQMQKSLQTAVSEVFGVQVLIHSVCQYPIVNLLGHPLGISEINTLLVRISTFTKLMLPGCELDNNDAAIIADALNKAPKLEHLNIGFNCIANSGAKLIAMALPHCTNLKMLHISCNNIGNAGATAVIEATRNFVNFKWNHNITEKGAEVLQMKLSATCTIECDGITVEGDEIQVFASKLRSYPSQYRLLQKLNLHGINNMQGLDILNCLVNL